LDSTDKFQIGIGKRVLKRQITANGIPVYSANVYEPFGRIDNSIFEDYSIGTVIWGIDGDWAVNYMPPNVPFYPTDHCGTLRVLTDEFNPHYIAFALNKEGKNQRFNRTNRASIDRISGLKILMPEKKLQDEFVKNVEELEAKIKSLEGKLVSVMEKKEGILEKYL